MSRMTEQQLGGGLPSTQESPNDSRSGNGRTAKRLRLARGGRASRMRMFDLDEETTLMPPVKWRTGNGSHSDSFDSAQAWLRSHLGDEMRMNRLREFLSLSEPFVRLRHDHHVLHILADHIAAGHLTLVKWNRPQPAPTALWALVHANFPVTNCLGIYNDRNVHGTNKKSLHAEGPRWLHTGLSRQTVFPGVLTLKIGILRTGVEDLARKTQNLA